MLSGKFKILFLSVFLLSALFRLGLTLINQQANNDELDAGIIALLIPYGVDIGTLIA